MRYCSKCGQQVADEAVICIKCGCTLDAQSAEKNDLSILEGILCFFFPIIGIVLYFAWKDNKPNKSKKALNVSLISIVASLVFGFFIGFFSAL